jgi:Helicase associated domain
VRNIPNMNVMKQLADDQLQGLARRSSSGALAASFASLDAFGTMDEDEDFCFDDVNDAPLIGTASSGCNVFAILDEVELVLSARNGPMYDDDDLQHALLEPTPIAPHRAQIVKQVQVTENSWHSDDAFLHVLHPLLPKRKQQNWQDKDNEDHLYRPSKKRRANTTSMDSLEATTASVDSFSTGSSSAHTMGRFRSYQAEQWCDRYDDLVAFRGSHGHCLVPHNMPENPALAQWVKRQRYQHKLLTLGKHSTLTHDRVMELESLGFVWDSHAATWEERFDELRLFKANHGHTNVPANFKSNPSLAIWIKCQRRQQQLIQNGEPSTMTHERKQKLDGIGFVWNPRKGGH